MADRLETALDLIERMLEPDQSAIQLYRADYATPTDLAAMRFWAQGEYNRIQSGFASTDTAVKTIASALSELIGAIDELGESGGLEGPQGPTGATGAAGRDGADGRDGVDGNAGDLIDDNRSLYSKTWSSQRIEAEIAAATAGTGLRWIDYCTSYNSTPTLVGTIASGDVYEYPYLGKTLYRLVGVSDDSFYQAFDGAEVYGLVAQKAATVN